MEWFNTWDWGDVPGWISAVVAIALPLVAYIERNRIAGFFRRKADEPTPTGPPVRWVLRPSKQAGVYTLSNLSTPRAYNVTVTGHPTYTEILTHAYWEKFDGESYGTFAANIDSDYRHMIAFTVTWQDQNGDSNEINLPVDGQRTRATPTKDGETARIDGAARE